MLCKVKKYEAENGHSHKKASLVTVPFLLAFLLLFSCVFFTGCGQDSSESVIRTSLEKELNSIKNLDAAFIADLETDMDIERFADYGINAQDFMRSYLSGFNYSIDSITINKDRAEAVITLTCKSFSEYGKLLEKASEEMLASQGDVSNLTLEQINAQYGKLLMDTLNEVPVAPTKPITLTYTLEGNTWEPLNATQYEISTALLTN